MAVNWNEKNEKQGGLHNRRPPFFSFFSFQFTAIGYRKNKALQKNKGEIPK